MTVQMSHRNAYLQMNTVDLWKMSQKELKERFDKNKIIYYFDNVILKDGAFGKIIEETRSGAKTYKLYDSWDEIENSHKGLWNKCNLERESIEYNKKTQELLKNEFNNQGNPSYSYACYSENIKVTEGIHGIIALIKDEYWKFPNWDYIKINHPEVYEQYEKLQEKLNIEEVKLKNQLIRNSQERSKNWKTQLKPFRYDSEKTNIEKDKLIEEFKTQGKDAQIYYHPSLNIMLIDGKHGLIEKITFLDGLSTFHKVSWDKVKESLPEIYVQYEQKNNNEFNKMLEYCKNNERYIQDFLPTTIYHFNLKKSKSMRKVILKDKIFTTEKGIVIDDLRELIDYVDSWWH